MFSVVMWSVWGAVALLFIMIRIYMMGLSRDEDDQLVLDEAMSRVQAEQAVITARLNKIEPVKRTVMVLLGAMTLVVIVYYVVDMVRQFQ